MSEVSQALKTIADCLSRRSHSKKELALKLAQKDFSQEVIDQALEKAEEKKWLEGSEELAQKTLLFLHKKNKSWAYIQAYLKEKDLPLPDYDRVREEEKARNLLMRKRGSLEGLSFEEKVKLKRFLDYRGFEKEVIDSLID